MLANILLYPVISALEKSTDIFHDGPVRLLGYITLAGCHTFSDMVIQARPLFADITGKNTPAGLSRKNVLERRHRPIEIPRQKRSEIPRSFSLIIADTKHAKDSGIIFVHRNANIGIAFVVTQKDIIVRLISFDHIGLENQRLEFIFHNNELKIRYMRYHREDFLITDRILSEVAAQTILQVLRFADIYY